jgi:alanyl-tRNA synthetase
MKAKDLKKKYLDFFRKRGHAIIPSASVIPENDPSVLFTTAGMHPLVPFLLGEKHPLGKRLADVQKCIRTGDIEEVGNEMHLSFFEMLGNWSLGDYFKKEAIEWSFEFLIKVLKFDPEEIYVTVFKGDKDAPRDEESVKIWQGLGISKERIFYLPKKDNWWGPAGETGPCGPCTEMFIDIGKKKCSKNCRPGCKCGKYFEIWNDVFMEYNKTKSGKYEKLEQRNVDTGMGLERTIAMIQEKKSVFETELFRPIMLKIKELSSKEDIRSERVIADHLKAATFILGDDKKIVPSNLDQGYVLRRFIRRAIRHGRILGINKNFCKEIAEIVIEMYRDDYDELKRNKEFIFKELVKEEEKFRKTLEKGLREFNKMVEKKKELSGKDSFLLFQSYGFPFEITGELCKEKKIKISESEFKKEFEKHQKLSRIGAEKKFKGGLSEQSPETVKLHTATHLLNEALRKVLGKKIVQRGSNITPERLRFDFNFDRKLTGEEIKKVEDLVNMKIKEGLAVKKSEMGVEEAKKRGAQAMFETKYGEKVSVYSIGDFSVEICMGPHVKNTKELGKFKIVKEEAISAGVRRIKAILS